MDFLASKGKAKIAHSGEVVVRQNTQTSFQRLTQLFTMDSTVPAENTEEQPDGWFGQAFDKVLDAFGRTSPDNQISVGKDNQTSIVRDDTNQYGFTMTVKASSIAPEAAVLHLDLENSSLIGYQSSGAPRIQKGNKVSSDIMISTKRNRFVIGGLEKREVVRGSNGVPWLKDIPVLGYLFQTESESTRKSQLVVVADCEYVLPGAAENPEAAKKIGEIKDNTADAGGANRYFFRQHLLDSDR